MTQNAYPGLERVDDEATRECLRLVFERINTLFEDAEDQASRIDALRILYDALDERVRSLE